MAVNAIGAGSPGPFDASDRTASRPFPARQRGPRITAFLESIARLTSPVL